MTSLKITSSRLQLVDQDGYATKEFFRALEELQRRTGGISGEMFAEDITLVPTGDVVATDVQAGIAELASEKATVVALAAHTSNTSNPHATTAAQVGADPTGTASASIAAHLAASDPHTQYALEAALAASATTDTTNASNISSGALAVARGGTGVSSFSWSTWVPVIASTSGTITSTTLGYARYFQIGKLVFFNLRFTLTNNGTGGSQIVVTLPVAGGSYNRFPVHGVNATTPITLVAEVNPSTPSVLLNKYDGTYPGATGNVIDVAGIYESV